MLTRGKNLASEVSPNFYKALLAIETVLDYVEVDLAVEELSCEGCVCEEHC